jgi:peroxin-1
MPKKAKVKYKSLRSNLVHLPLSLYASLTQQQIVSYKARVNSQANVQRPQSIVLHLEPLTPSSSRATAGYLGWSGLTSSSSLTRGVGGEETVEIDPEVAMGLGWNEGMLVSFIGRSPLTKLINRLKLGSSIIPLKQGM